MGTLSWMHWLIVALVVLVFFGRGKIPELMGDIAKGIKSFKAGMREDETPAAEARREIDTKADVAPKAGETPPTPVRAPSDRA